MVLARKGLYRSSFFLSFRVFCVFWRERLPASNPENGSIVLGAPPYGQACVPSCFKHSLLEALSNVVSG